MFNYTKSFEDFLGGLPPPVKLESRHITFTLFTIQESLGGTFQRLSITVFLKRQNI